VHKNRTAGLLEGGAGGFRTISYRHEPQWSCSFVLPYAITAIDHIFIQFHSGLSYCRIIFKMSGYQEFRTKITFASKAKIPLS
jgi:hypothetical protein